MPPRLTFPIPYANLFYRSQRSDNISKSNDEESSLPDILQRNPGGCRLRAAASDAERDGWKADEHGFRAAHRTMGMNYRAHSLSMARLRRIRPLQRESAAQALAEAFSVRERRREVVTR